MMVKPFLALIVGCLPFISFGTVATAKLDLSILMHINLANEILKPKAFGHLPYMLNRDDFFYSFTSFYEVS